MPVPCSFRLTPCSYAAVTRLASALGVSEVTAQVLVRRGHDTPAGARAFLAAAESHPPEAFDGLDAALSLIRAHVRSGEQITVHGDYDCDGVCSTAVLVRCLRDLGANVDWHVPDRLADGYGLAAATVERLASRGTRLLVTADCAVTAVEEVALARSLGMRVIVTDHHQPRADGALPEADALVHPALCGYPCPDLCATGVAAKVAQALRGSPCEDDLALTALATVADVVPLVGENRRLVREGVAALSRTTRPGLRALMEAAQVDPVSIDERTLGFRLAPRINAAGRLYTPDTALELLLTDDDARAVALAQELDRANAERRHVETRILFEAEAQVAAAGEAPAYVLAGEGWHPGVIGIVAARIVERHNRPAVLIALPGGGDAGAAPATSTGSGRSISAFDLLGGLNACAEHLLRHGGHRVAAGLTIEPAGVDAFREAFVAHAASVLSEADFVRVERADAVAAGRDLGLDLAEELATLGPFGAANPEISLLVAAATFSDPVGFGGEKRSDHVRFSVESGGAKATAVAFGGGGRLPVAAGEPVDATFRLERNEWRGRVEPRLVLRAARASEPSAPIGVLGERDYLARALRRLDAAPRLEGGGERLVRDVRGRAVAAAITELAGSGERTVVLCASVEARLGPLSERLGGFDIASYEALGQEPGLLDTYRHVVVLDPPATAEDAAACVRGDETAMTHLVWGATESRFALRVHEYECSLREPVNALYRHLREAGAIEGEAALLDALAAADPGARSPVLAGRSLEVLLELGLARLERDSLSLAAAEPAQGASLRGSMAFCRYERRRQAGLAGAEALLTAHGGGAGSRTAAQAADADAAPAQEVSAAASTP
jgi:single-stranded-DNA-specific exonuclease